MSPSTQPIPDVSEATTHERLVLLQGGEEASRALHPAAEGKTQGPEGLPKGFFDANLLLLIGEKATHGYDLASRMEEMGFPGTDTGVLYRHLRRLERSGLVVSQWEAALSGPPRRTYRLTDEGVIWLSKFAGTAFRARHRLSTFVKRCRDARLA